MRAGDYIQPLVRVTNAAGTIVSGYVGIRLSTADSLNAATNANQLTLQNVGTTSFSLQLMGAADHSPGASRTNVGSAIALVPNGYQVVSASPTLKYLEVWGTSGTGQLKMQLASVNRWNNLAFSKVDTSYPVVQLTQPVGASTLTTSSANSNFGATGSAGEVTS